MRTDRKRQGISLTETILASAILASAMIPCIKALTSSHILTTTVERKTRSLVLARQQIEDIRAKAIYDYSKSYSSNKAIENSYVCKVTDNQISSNLRRIVVKIGFDADNNGTLSDAECLAMLETLIARRWQ